MNKGFLTVIASVAISTLAAYGVLKAETVNQPQQQQKTVYNEQGQPVRTVNLSLSDYPDFTYAAETAVEAVVFVKVTVRSQYQNVDPILRYFFGFGDQGGERQGSGSGVIIRKDGYIVTNNHVVANATKVEVTLNNNETYDATVVGTDAATDVALLKIEASDLPCLQFADSDKLRLGEWVLAIGSPLGEELRSTITAGIVSAKGRSMPSNSREFKIESFIQTDAAVNPGNSGGALVNKMGELVGINTAIVSTTGSYTGYSFAVPSNIVQRIVSDLIDFGSVKRVMLGIAGGNVTKEISEKLKLSSTEGVYVSEVSKNGAADKAGVKPEDVIIGLDDTRIATMANLQAKVNSYHPGESATLRVIREGKTIELKVKFEEQANTEVAVNQDGTVVFYGATLAPAKDGVLIASAGNGKLAQAGGRDGYIIRYVNDQKVSKPQDVVDIAKKSKRSIIIEGRTPTGSSVYFGFGKDE